MSLKKYFATSKTSKSNNYNRSKTDTAMSAMNTSVNSQQRIAPPSTMPINKTFNNSKLLIRKLQIKTINETHK